MLGAYRRARDLLRYRGAEHLCPICDRSCGRFKDFGVHPRPAMCPWCGSLERHRLLWLYLERETDVLGSSASILHIAPEEPIRRSLRHRARYVTTDLERRDVDICADLADGLPIADASFEVIIASHVLEHIPDDAAAMDEMARVLAPSGVAYLLVPTDPDLERTDEVPIDDPQERARRYGQPDHVRMYGADFPERLRYSGFTVERVDYRDRLSYSEIHRFGVPHEVASADTIWVARPSRSDPR